MSVLLTGATGFVGKAVLKNLTFYDVTCLGRTRPEHFHGNFIQSKLTGDTQINDFGKADIVIHCAARAHVMSETVGDPIELYREVNTRGTLNLAKHAAAQGVKRFIFISSIKVNGESTEKGEFISAHSPVNPTDPYGVSKSEAEIGLKKLSTETGMEIVVIRPPLVYGPGVKANFASMMKIAKKNLPLPLGAIHNKRSLVALDNLVDLIVTCVNHPNAGNQTFLVSDDRDVSTTELLEIMTRSAGSTPRLIPVRQIWLERMGKILGKQAVIERLCGNLQVDITHTRKTLNWEPPLSLEEGIKRCFDG